MDGWKFHYQVWKDSKMSIWCDGSNSANPYPENRKGRLDYDLLKNMGLTNQRIVQGDALFLKQLLQPMCNPKKSWTDNDPRLPYYSHIENWTAKYAANISMYGSYGHVQYCNCRGASLLGFIYEYVRYQRMSETGNISALEAGQ